VPPPATSRSGLATAAPAGLLPSSTTLLCSSHSCFKIWGQHAHPMCRDWASGILSASEGARSILISCFSPFIHDFLSSTMRCFRFRIQENWCRRRCMIFLWRCSSVLLYVSLQMYCVNFFLLLAQDTAVHQDKQSIATAHGGRCCWPRFPKDHVLGDGNEQLHNGVRTHCWSGMRLGRGGAGLLECW
jgi:hypothetical protein